MPHASRGATSREAVKTNSPIVMSYVMPDTRPSLESIIGGKIKPNAKGCWIYNNQPDEYGVARTRVGEIRVHRFVYETLVAPIPEGYHLHHKCFTPGCCNPEHCEPLPPSEHGKYHTVTRPRDEHGMRWVPRNGPDERKP
jgi:hypothetical protein